MYNMYSFYIHSKLYITYQGIPFALFYIQKASNAMHKQEGSLGLAVSIFFFFSFKLIAKSEKFALFVCVHGKYYKTNREFSMLVLMIQGIILAGVWGGFFFI